MLTASEWQPLLATHLERVRRWTVPYRSRRSKGRVHPVHDFLFQYYAFSTTRLEEWHPQPDQAIESSREARDRYRPPHYEERGGCLVHSTRGVKERDRDRLTRTIRLLEAISNQPPNYGCFGMHEWAMVYGGSDVRHAETAPLRLSQAEVDRFVESRPIVCTHFDAFRFFDPSARPLNRVQPTPDSRVQLEQPGCVHANMDLYRWAYESMPWVGTDLLWESFELAADFRELDMQASPYDLSSFGVVPIPMETEGGRAHYQKRQKALARRAVEVRARLLSALRAFQRSLVEG